MKNKLTAGAAMAALWIMGGMSPAHAIDDDNCQAGASTAEAADCTVQVEAVTLDPIPASPSVAAPGIEVAGRQQLPVTGSDAGTIAALGAALVAGGVVLTWRSRRSADTR